MKLYNLPKGFHTTEDINRALTEHPEIKFVSLVAVDIYGHDTDEKIPVAELLRNPEKFLNEGVQTDGSSVLLPLIADISNASVKLIPDLDCNWYVDYNSDNGVGTLRIPAFLVHNETHEVGSRVILRDAIKYVKEGILNLLRSNPYVFEYIGIDKADDIEDIEFTSATELEFYVKTPNDAADREKLHASQERKEQYWKRTVGPVRTALEETLLYLDNYGFGVEMGHKEVGGVNAQISEGGDLDHIMEQLEIDWKYSDPMQAADNDYQIRYFVRDIFRQYGLAVTYMAKPIEGVAGSGKHTHFGVSAKLKDGRHVNLMAARDPFKDYMSPIGFGAIMGLLKNYEVINPIANCTTDALNRLKPGYEAPICAVTSLGNDVTVPSRNRTVLACLVREPSNPMATRFELRSPNPKSNTYLVIAAGLMAMLDGITAAVSSGKTPANLLTSISKGYGDPDFYLEQKREYRVECNIFDDYTPSERSMLFGASPATVWENIRGFDEYPAKTEVLHRGDVFDKVDIESFKVAALEIWVSDLLDNVVPSMRDTVRKCKKLHGEEGTDLDNSRFEEIEKMSKNIAQDTSETTCLLTQLTRALEEKDYATASSLQLKAQAAAAALDAVYTEYKKNII